jgi:hypothetical protein
MFEIIKEITEWNLAGKQPNHTYLIDKKGRILAFAKWHSNAIDILKSRPVIDKRYRKFIKTEHNELSKLIDSFKKEYKEKESIKEKPQYDRLFKVKSGEKEYQVYLNKKQLICNCTGFNYRGKCKHIDFIKEKFGV